MQMFCVKINMDDYTMSVPLQILAPLAADQFNDGKSLVKVPSYSDVGRINTFNCWKVVML